MLVSLVFSYFTTDRGKLSFSNFSMSWLLLAMLLALLPWGWHCLRLAIWSRFFEVKISWKNLLRIVVATDVGGAVTPTAVGGAPLKLAMLAQHGYRPGQATLLTLLGNFEDLLFYVFAIPVSLFLTSNWDNPLWLETSAFLEKNYQAALAVVFGMVALTLFFKKIKRRFWKNSWLKSWQEKWRHTVHDFREAAVLIWQQGRKPFIFSFLALSAQWLTRFCILLATVRALGLEADFFQLLLLQWLVFVAILLTPTPGGAGGAEAAFLLVFGKILPEGTGGGVMAGWRFLTYYFMLLVGVSILAGVGSSLFKKTSPAISDAGLPENQNSEKFLNTC